MAPGKRLEVPWGVSMMAVSVIAVIFLIFRIVERLWLTEANTSILYLLHIIMGIATFAITGFSIVWYISRKDGSFFPIAEGEASQILRRQQAPQERMIHLSLWFIKMRWLACIVAITLIVVTVKSLDFLEEAVFWPLVISVALLAASNLIYTLLLQYRRLIQWLHGMQIISDLVILTAMLHYSGGIENPMFLMFILHVIIGGILLTRRECYAIVLMTLVLFGTASLLEMTDIIQHYTLEIYPHGHAGEDIIHSAHKPLYVFCILGLQFTIMAMTAYFITGIMDKLRAEERNVRMIGQRLERIVQASGAGFAILDPQLHPLWLNDQIKKWLKMPPAAMMLAPDGLTEQINGTECPAMRTLKDGQIRVTDCQRVDSDGNKRFFQVTIAPLHDGKGDVCQVVQLMQDMTHQKLIEAEMMHRSKMAALGVMAAGVAHEIGNPLASISTRLLLLKESHEEDYLQESIGLLEKEISRIGRILHGVSQFARPSKATWSTCRINAIVMETLNMLRLDRKAKGCRIESDLSELLPQTTGSQDELLQVFFNLGLNALEKMPDGGKLTVGTSMSAGEISVFFADTGPGISKENLSKIFTPFFSTKKQGLGLGLYIAHNIIQAHNGSIDVQSELNAGTVITVVLPVRVVNLPGDMKKT